MADLKAEQIMVALLAKITGLATTGANVDRLRVYDIVKTQMPFLMIGQGADRVDGEFFNPIQIQSTLDFFVRIYVKQNITVETTLNQIRKEVHAAIMLDKTLGLPFRVSVFPVGASAPIQDLTDTQLGYMDLNFSVRYTYQLTDASV